MALPIKQIILTGFLVLSVSCDVMATDAREKPGQERLSWGAWFKECINSVKAKTIPEAFNDSLFYQTLYQQKIDQIREGMLSGEIHKHQLEQELNDMSEFIGVGVLIPPHHHIKTLGQLQENTRRTGYGLTFHKVIDDFITNLHEQKPEFHKKSFLQDSIRFLSEHHKYTSQKKRNQDLRKLFAFYAKYQDPLDYAESLEKFFGLAEANQKKLELDEHHLMKIHSLLRNAWALYMNTPFFQEKLQKAKSERIWAQTAAYVEEQMALAKRLLAEAKEATDRKKAPRYTNFINDAYAYVSKAAQFANENKFGLGALALVMNVPAAAAGVVLGTEFRINGIIGGNVAGLADGNVAIVGRDGSNNQIGQILNPYNGTVLNTFNISTTPPVSTVIPTVDNIGIDYYGVAWKQDSSSINTRTYYLNGTALAAPFKVNQITYPSMGGGLIKGLSDGNLLVIWGGASPGTYLLRARIFSPMGAPLTNEFSINQATADVIGGVSATNVGINTLILWNAKSILARSMASNSTFLGNEFPVNQSASNSFGIPSVAGIGNESAAAVYNSENNNILGRIIQNSAPVGSGFTVPDAPNINQKDSPFVVRISSNVLALWYDAITGEVKGTIYSPVSTPLTGEFGILPNNTIGGAHTATTLPDGSAFVKWQRSIYMYGRVVSYVPEPTPTPTPVSSSSVTPTPTPTSSSTSATATPTSTSSTSSSVTPSPAPQPGSTTPTPTLWGSTSASTTPSPTPTSTPTPISSSTTQTPTPVTSGGRTLEPPYLFKIIFDTYKALKRKG